MNVTNAVKAEVRNFDRLIYGKLKNNLVRKLTDLMFVWHILNCDL